MRRRLTQAQLAVRAGFAQSTISQLERGMGGSLSVESWKQVGLVLSLPLDLAFARDPLETPADAGHLDMQELILRLGRATGRGRHFELPTRPANPALSTDVGLVDDALRLLILIECVNLTEKLNAAFRSSERKRAEAEALAIALGHGRPFAVRQCWVMRDTRRNRELVARYPEIFDARLPGSSANWATALARGGAPPAEPGLVWCDVRATRLFARRRR